MVAPPAKADMFFETQVLAARSVPGQPARVDLLVKITDTVPNGPNACSDKTTALLPPGRCSTRFDEDGRMAGRPCYFLQLWEGGVPVPAVEMTILDTVGFESWIVLRYPSPSRRQHSASVRFKLSAGGVINKDTATLHDLLVYAREDFDPDHPYRMLYITADKEMNEIYGETLNRLKRSDNTDQAELLLAAQRRWLRNMEPACGMASTEQTDRCRWVNTQHQIMELTKQW